MVLWKAIGSAAVIASFSIVALGNEPSGFADDLFGEGDYFRAIGEYKRLCFFAVDAESALHFQFRIGECWQRLRDYGTAKEYYDRILLQSGVSGELEKKAAIGSAVCLLNMGDMDYARIILQDLRAGGYEHDSLNFLIGVSYLKDGAWDEAEHEFAKIRARDLRKRADEFLNDISPDNFKSPRTALLLSSFIPGAGQIYAGRPFKGIISFSLNLSLGYLTYKAYAEDRKLDGFLIIYFGLQRFYFGNLRQARQYTAEYNQRVRERIQVE
jgi:TM2 domain-containing membrane protein YozV